MTPNLHAGSREFHGNLTNAKEIHVLFANSRIYWEI